MRTHLAVLVGMVVLVGGGVTATVAADGELPPRPAVGQTISPDGLRLTISVADTVVRPMEPIETVTTLEYIGSGERITFDAAGQGPVRHLVRALHRDAEVEQVGWNLDCSPFELARGQVQEQQLDISVSVVPGAPDAAFNQMLMDDPGLHLPTGLWAIDAVLRYYPDRGCNGPETWAQATVIVSVQGKPWPSASPDAG
jgi:hypothetical protein